MDTPYTEGLKVEEDGREYHKKAELGIHCYKCLKDLSEPVAETLDNRIYCSACYLNELDSHYKTIEKESEMEKEYGAIDVGKGQGLDKQLIRGDLCGKSDEPDDHADPTDTQQRIIEVCDGIRTLLLEKNRAYGDSAINPVRIFSSASPTEQILVRMDDKLSRISRGEAMGEDIVNDLIGYLVLYKVSQGWGER